MASAKFSKIPIGSSSITSACKGSITQVAIQRIEATGKRFTIRDTGQPGLILRVGASGSLTWALDYKDREGKRQTYRIGTPKNYSVKDAREEAQRLVGSDPAAERRRKKLAEVEAKQEKKLAKSRTLRAYLDGEYRRRILSHRRTGENTRKILLYAFEEILDQDMVVLTVGQIEDIVAKMVKGGTKPQSVNRKRTALMALLNKAVEHEILPVNPLARWKKLAIEEDKRVRWLGQNDDHEDIRDENENKVGERQRLITALKKQPGYIQTLVKLAMNTGLRRGELFGLIWGNVDLKSGLLTVTAATAKSAKTRRVELNTDAVALLRKWKGNVTSIDGRRLVFPSPATGKREKNAKDKHAKKAANKPLTDIKHSWATLVKEAQLDDFRFHDLRHDFASRLVQLGAPLDHVRDLLGHSSVTLTERYAHLAPHLRKAAVELLV